MEVMKWQLDHPKGTKDECATWLKEEVDTGRLTLDSSRKTGQAQEVGDGPRSKKVKLSKDK